MRQYLAFLKKEWTEQARSGRLLLIGILFCLFGIMNPLVAKLTPWLMKMMSDQLAESGITVGEVTVTAMDSWVQYYKNMPTLLIVFVVLLSGILTTERQKGTLINIVTKGMKRSRILAAKALVLTALWTAGTLICYGITYGYNAYFWDNSVAAHYFAGAALYWLFGLWIISVIMPASVLCGSAAGVALSAGVVFGAGYVLGLFPATKKLSPAYLSGAQGLLSGQATPAEFLPAAVIALVLIAVHVVLAMAAFDRKEL